MSSAAFVGYEEELRRARAYVRAHPVVLIEGIEGAGKTAFLDRLACSIGSQRSLRPILLACRKGSDLGALLAEASRLFAPSEPPAPPPEDPAAIESCLGGLVEAIERARALLLLDDCERLCGAGIERLLERLARGLVRSRAVAASSRRLHLAFPFEVDCPRIVLRGLASEQAVRLVTGIFERSAVAPPASELVEEIAGRVGAHPLALKLVAAGLISAGSSGGAAIRPGWGALPPGALSGLAGVLSGLSEEERRLLAASRLAAGRGEVAPVPRHTVAGGPRDPRGRRRAGNRPPRALRSPERSGEVRARDRRSGGPGPPRLQGLDRSRAATATYAGRA